MLCKKNYYNNTKFHRLVPKFVLQGGDPTNTGAGGDSAFEGKPFRDEFDMRITHAHRGILSMANSGPNTNGSQFFLTLNETKHLDLKHTVFGRVVGGAAVLDAIEAVSPALLVLLFLFADALVRWEQIERTLLCRQCD
jgi:peptidyl-prolyl cis-trans isomerase-like protein 2